MTLSKNLFISLVILSTLSNLVVALDTPTGSNSEQNVVEYGSTCQCNCCHLCPAYKQQEATHLIPTLSTAVSANGLPRGGKADANIATGQNQTSTAPKRRRKNKKNRPAAGKIQPFDNTTIANNLSSTISYDVAPPVNPTLPQPTTSTVNLAHERNTEEVPQTTSTTTALIVAATTDVIALTSGPKLSITPAPKLYDSAPPDATTSDQRSGQDVEESTTISTNNQNFMSENLTDDLIKLLCSYRPDWLIKTKLSDGRLVSAIQKQKLKVRAYRPIFGILEGNKHSETINPNAASTNLNQAFLISDTKPPTSLPNIFLRLSNTTSFITAMGSAVYHQPLNEVISAQNLGAKLGPDSTENSVPHLGAKDGSSSSSGTPSRIYLIFGTGSSNSTHSKLASAFVVWPSQRNRPSSAADLPPILRQDGGQNGSQEIMKAYRVFKMNGSSVCNPYQGAQAVNSRSSTTTATTTTMLATTPKTPNALVATIPPDTMMQPVNRTDMPSEQRKRPRSRKHKRKESELRNAHTVDSHQ